jgi:hypothetical protein
MDASRIRTIRNRISVKLVPGIDIDFADCEKELYSSKMRVFDRVNKRGLAILSFVLHWVSDSKKGESTYHVRKICQKTHFVDCVHVDAADVKE